MQSGHALCNYGRRVTIDVLSEELSNKRELRHRAVMRNESARQRDVVRTRNLRSREHIGANRISSKKRKEPYNSRICPGTPSQVNVTVEKIEYNSAKIQLKGAKELV